MCEYVNTYNKLKIPVLDVRRKRELVAQKQQFVPSAPGKVRENTVHQPANETTRR